MYEIEILNPKTGEVIEVRTFHSEYEAIHYGEQYKSFVESLDR